MSNEAAGTGKRMGCASDGSFCMRERCGLVGMRERCGLVGGDDARRFGCC